LQQGSPFLLELSNLCVAIFDGPLLGCFNKLLVPQGMNQNEAQLQVWAMQWMDLDGAKGGESGLPPPTAVDAIPSVCNLSMVAAQMLWQSIPSDRPRALATVESLFDLPIYQLAIA